MSFLTKLPLYSKSDLRYLCEQLIPFTSLKSMHYGSTFCPFHYNVNTPAGSLFKDKDGVERLYCYSCRKQYTSYDYITLVLEEKPINHLLKKFKKEELDNILKNKIDKQALELQKLEFTDMSSFLTEIYNFDCSLSPLEN